MFQPADRRLIANLSIYLDAINKANGSALRWEWTGTGLNPMIKVIDNNSIDGPDFTTGTLDVIHDAIKDRLREEDLKDPG